MELLAANISKVYIICSLVISSFALRFTLNLFGQRWINTIAHTGTLIFLPMLTYVITTVISGNIALSLGMVGALSIVRFRNPVRSPLELTVYFASVTMGIAAAVDVYWLLFLLGALFLGGASLYYANLMSMLLVKKPFFSASFTEGNAKPILEVTSTAEIDILACSNYTVIVDYNGADYTYVATANSYQDLKCLLERVSSLSEVKEYKLSAG